MIELDLVSRHGDGSAHRKWPNVAITEDPWGFLIRPGSPVTEADGSAWSSSYPVIALFWPTQFYQVFVLLKESTTEYYCNVIAPVEFHPGDRTLAFVDLELDVYVSEAGVDVRDEEEFAATCGDYSKEWVSGATLAVAELVRLGNEQRGPFSESTAAWWRGRVAQTRSTVR